MAFVVKKNLSSWSEANAADELCSESLQVDQGSAQYTDAWRATMSIVIISFLFRSRWFQPQIVLQIVLLFFQLLHLAVVILQALYLIVLSYSLVRSLMILMRGHPASVPEEILGTPFTEAKMRRFLKMLEAFLNSEQVGAQ